MVRLTLKTKFILAFVGLTLLFAGTFGLLAAARLRYTLSEQVRLRAKIVAEEFAREANRFIATPEGQPDEPTSSRVTRRLIVNADDFGLTRGVSAGILAARRHGIVTGTTVLVTAALDRDQLAEARASGLGIGLHVNLTLGRPLTGAKSFT